MAAVKFATVDGNELAVRIAAALFGAERPEGVPADLLLAAMHPDERAIVKAAADAAGHYFVEVYAAAGGEALSRPMPSDYHA